MQGQEPGQVHNHNEAHLPILVRQVEKAFWFCYFLLLVICHKPMLIAVVLKHSFPQKRTPVTVGYGNRLSLSSEVWSSAMLSTQCLSWLK